MKLVKTIIATAALLTAPSVAQADSRYHHSDYRPQYQYGNGYYYPHPNYSRPNYQNYRPNYGYGNDAAIRNGIRSGQLSSSEVRELRDDQREIADKRRQYLADGHLSNNERKSLQNEINDYNKDLRHELNDGERGNAWNWGRWW